MKAAPSDSDDHNFTSRAKKRKHMTSNILIHPLAVVAMADHFTRVNLGATLLSADSKILGILFGTREEGGKLVINDSIEVSCESWVRE